MEYICNDCKEVFAATKKPKCCPFCLSEKLICNGKSRQTALPLIKQCNQLTAQLDELMAKYKPIYLERECILSTLRIYKRRGIITEEEMPKIKRENIQKELAEYRKKRKEENHENKKHMQRNQ